MLLSLLLFSSLGTSAIVTQHRLPITRVMDVAPSLITPAPVVDYQAIFARDSVPTCGYVSGKAASPLTCPSSYTCTSTLLDYFPHWGCCDQIQCKGNYNQCQDYGGNICMNLGDEECSKIYTSILKCSSAAPSCVTYARSRSLGDLTTEVSLGCGKASGTILALISTVGGQGNNAEATSAPGGNSAPASSTNLAQSADGIGASSTSDSAQPTNNPSHTDGADSSNNSSNKGGKLSVGEIAGIAVPIVAIIVAVVVGWWKRHQVVWCFTCGWRGHKHSQRSTRLKSLPPKVHGDYGPVNTQPDHIPPPYNQLRPSPYLQNLQASYPSISTQQSFHTGRPAPQNVFTVYGGN